MPPAKLPLNDAAELLRWYEQRLCRAHLRDPRGLRVCFLPETFVHLIQLKNKYGDEPRNRAHAVEEIRRGRIKLIAGRFDPQRTEELSWAVELATAPDVICGNWQALGTGGEAYVKNFGTETNRILGVMICEVAGAHREVVTVFPRERLAERDLLFAIWPPQKSEGAATGRPNLSDIPLGSGNSRSR